MAVFIIVFITIGLLPGLIFALICMTRNRRSNSRSLSPQERLEKFYNQSTRHSVPATVCNTKPPLLHGDDDDNVSRSTINDAWSSSTDTKSTYMRGGGCLEWLACFQCGKNNKSSDEDDTILDIVVTGSGEVNTGSITKGEILEEHNEINTKKSNEYNKESDSSSPKLLKLNNQRPKKLRTSFNKEIQADSVDLFVQSNKIESNSPMEAVYEVPEEIKVSSRDIVRDKKHITNTHTTSYSDLIAHHVDNLCKLKNVDSNENNLDLNGISSIVEMQDNFLSTISSNETNNKISENSLHLSKEKNYYMSIDTQVRHDSHCVYTLYDSLGQENKSSIINGKFRHPSDTIERQSTKSPGVSFPISVNSRVHKRGFRRLTSYTLSGEKNTTQLPEISSDKRMFFNCAPLKSLGPYEMEKDEGKFISEQGISNDLTGIVSKEREEHGNARHHFLTKQSRYSGDQSRSEENDKEVMQSVQQLSENRYAANNPIVATVLTTQHAHISEDESRVANATSYYAIIPNRTEYRPKNEEMRQHRPNLIKELPRHTTIMTSLSQQGRQLGGHSVYQNSTLQSGIENETKEPVEESKTISNVYQSVISDSRNEPNNSITKNSKESKFVSSTSFFAFTHKNKSKNLPYKLCVSSSPMKRSEQICTETIHNPQVSTKLRQNEDRKIQQMQPSIPYNKINTRFHTQPLQNQTTNTSSDPNQNQLLSFTTVASSSFCNSNAIYKQGNNHLNIRKPDEINRRNPIVSTMLNEDNQLKEQRKGSTFEESTCLNERGKIQPHQRNVDDVRLITEFEQVVARDAYKRDDDIIKMEPSQTFHPQNTYAQNKTIQSEPTENALTQSLNLLNSSTINVHCNHQGEVRGLPNTSYYAATLKNQGQYYPFVNVRNDSEQMRSLNDHVIKKQSFCVFSSQNTSSQSAPTPNKSAPIYNAPPYSDNNKANNSPLIQRQHGVGVPVTSYYAILPNNHGKSYLHENRETGDNIQNPPRSQNPLSLRIPAIPNAPAQISPTSNKSIYTQQPIQSRLIQTSPQFIKQRPGVARSSPLTSYHAISQNNQAISSSYPHNKINKSKNPPGKQLSLEKPKVDQNSICSFAPAQNLHTSTQNASTNITTTQYVPFTERQQKQEGGLPTSSYYAIVPKDQGQSYPYANVRISENASKQINTQSTDTAKNDLFSVAQAQNTPTHSLSSIRNVDDKSHNEPINENRQVLNSINQRLVKQAGDNKRLNDYSPQPRKSPILSSLLKLGGPSVEGQIGSTSALTSRYAFASTNNTEEQNTVVPNKPNNISKITINQRQVLPQGNQQSTMLNHQPMVNTNNDSFATSNIENGLKNWELLHSNNFGEEEVKTAIPNEYQNMDGFEQDLITAQNHSNVVELMSAHIQQKPDKQQALQDQDDRKNPNKYRYDPTQDTVRRGSSIISSTDKSEKTSALSRAPRMKTIWKSDDNDTASRFPFTSYYAFVPRNQGEFYPHENMKFENDSSGRESFVKQNQLTHSMIRQKAERDNEIPDSGQIRKDTTQVQTSQHVQNMKDKREHIPTQNNYAIRSHNSQRMKQLEELNSSYEAMLPVHCQTRLQNNCRQNDIHPEQLITVNENLKLKAEGSSLLNPCAERKNDIKSPNKLPVESPTGTILRETLRECKTPLVSWDVVNKKDTMKVPKPYSMHIPGDSGPSEHAQWNNGYDDIMARKAISSPSLLSRGKVGDMQRGDMRMEKRVSKFFNNYQFIPEIPRIQTVMYEQVQQVRNVVPQPRENIHVLPEQNTNLIPLLINRPTRSVQEPNNSSNFTHYDLQNRENLGESNSFPSTSFYGFIPRNQGQYPAREGIFAHPGYPAKGPDYIPYNVNNPITMRTCIKAEESDDESDSTSESSDESYEQTERKPVYSVPKPVPPVYWKHINQKRQEENADKQRAEKQRVHDILNQFSSIHISHNMKDPIPKDPETMPGFKTSTSRRQLAESLSYYGSSQYRMLPSRTQIKPAPRPPEKRKSHSFFNRHSRTYSVLIADNNQGVSSGVEGKESDVSVEMKSDNLERSVMPDPERTANTEELDGKYEGTLEEKNSSLQSQLNNKYSFDSKSSRHSGKTRNDSNVHMLRDNLTHISSTISGRKSNQIFDRSSFVPMQSSPSIKVKCGQKLNSIPTGSDSPLSLNEEKVLSIHSPNSLPKINHLSREINSSLSTIVYQQGNGVIRSAKSISRLNVTMVEPDEVEPYASPRHSKFEFDNKASNKQTDGSPQYSSYQQDAHSIIDELIDEAVSSNSSPTLRILPTPLKEDSKQFENETENRPYSNKKSVHFITEHTNNETLQAAQKGQQYEQGDENVDNSLAPVNYQPSVVKMHSQISPQCVQMPNRNSEVMSCDILGGPSYEFINMANFKSVTQQVSSRLYNEDNTFHTCIPDETNGKNLESCPQELRRTTQGETEVVEQNHGSRRSFVYRNDNLTSMQPGNAMNQSFVFRRKMSPSKKTYDFEDSQLLDSLNKNNTAHGPQPTRERKIGIQSKKREEKDPAPLGSTSNSSDRNSIASIIKLTTEPRENVIFTSERDVAERLRDKGVKHISEVYSPDFWKRRKLSPEEQEKEPDTTETTANTTTMQDSNEDTSNEYSCLHVSSSLKIDGLQNSDKEKSIDIKEKIRFTGAIESSLCHGVRQPSSRQERRSSKNVYFTLPHEPSDQEDTCSLERFTKNSKVQTSFPGVPALGTDATLRWSVVIKHRANQLFEAHETENEHDDTEPYTTPRSNE